MGDIFAGDPIPAGGAHHQVALLVHQLDRYPVNFRLAYVLDRLAALEEALDARVKLLHLLAARYVGERKHRQGVTDRRKLGQRWRADSLGWGMRVAQLWMLGL